METELGGGAKITTEALVKHFGAVKAVDGVDIEVAAGEIFGLLGPNGAGKTTTLRCLLGFLNPTSGQAQILGGNSRRKDIRRRVGYLPGDLRLEPKARVGSLLDWYAQLRGGVDPSYLAELCRRFHLDSNRRFGDLSKGNRQKVGVVQAVMHKPDVLILDEPTSGLDPLMQREVLRVVSERRDEGAAVIFSSHIIFEVEETADTVGIMRAGRLVVNGSVEELQRITARQSLHVRFAGPVTASDFDNIPGLVRVSATARTADLVLSGEVAPLLARLAELQATHLHTDPLALDDIFYGVYEGGSGGTAA